MPGRTSGRRATGVLHAAARRSSASRRQLIQGLLAPDTLLDVLRTCTVFMDTDAGQAGQGGLPLPAVPGRPHASSNACASGKTPEERSGVVWHTQGSGKSLTMVFVARMLRASTDLTDFKIFLVNDRIDLEEQLADTAQADRRQGERHREHCRAPRAPEHRHLRREHGDGAQVHGADGGIAADGRREALAPLSASHRTAETFGVVNPSERILLMIDEAHRTQSSDLGDNLFEAFPNATRIAFTGTPLITEQHGTKRTVKRFGEYIDTYKLMDAVHDGATLQILYEGRTADTALKDKHGFDTKFEDLFQGAHRGGSCSPSRRSTARPATSSKPRSGSRPSPAIWWTTTSTTSCPTASRRRWCATPSWRRSATRKSIRAALAERLDREKRESYSPT